ncbi:tRNA (N6-threonylcarbamoyladenosine(37)-N6)-methyltransferase TrmO [Bacillus marinisedimentorum]|uniref:tRNA (N6-threonylcarbamoyladenosine(37)-N6)-methyltransferase TrmO n=1 Tax=Bacillus marinisedimentorum TaxID=1821260 RepID=UPI00087319B5|nr:tRNA (N6-threonylcarbamoyladenosine(37)-N6)-methyltransferase TrmO [Bacillus marinisedimentorum]
MFTIKPIGYVKSSRKEVTDDEWGNITAEIELTDEFTGESLQGIEDFSHAEIVFYFHLVQDGKVEYIARHPRNNPAWPKTGVFAQRGKNRPNRLGITIVQIIKKEGAKLIVKGLDAVDGTPVIDIKPAMKELYPCGLIKQPEWADELMVNYWEKI